MKNQEPILRIPRIKGVTILAKIYQEDQGDDKKYFRLISHITTHYTQMGFTYLGYSLSLPDLCYYTELKEGTLQKAVTQASGIFSSLLNGTTQEAISRSLQVLVEGIISDAFVDKSRYTRLADGLEANTLYSNKKPNLNVIHAYIKAMELGTRQTQNLMSLIALIMPKTATNQVTIFNQIATDPQGPSAAKFLTREEASQLLEAPRFQALTDTDNLALLQSTYSIDSTIEVRANGSEEKGPLTTRTQSFDALSEFIIEDISDASLVED